MARTRRSSSSSHDIHSGAVLAAALDPIITIDASGIIESASDSVVRVFGWTPAELIGRNISVLMPEPHRSAHDGYLAHHVATGQMHNLNTTRRFDAQRKDGSEFPIELSVSRADVPVRGGPLFVGIVRDLSDSTRFDIRDGGQRGNDGRRLQELVTEQTKALEQAHFRLRLADRMASIGTLAAGLGHDMNNVLLPVRAQINVLLAASSRLTNTQRSTRESDGLPVLGDPPINIRSAVEAISASIAYLQQLADGLHYLAQDPDRTQPDGAATDLRDWWARAGIVISKSVPTHVKLSASIPRDLPPVGIAPHRLTQAALNLVINAGEAIPTLAADPTRRRRQGRVRVTARVQTDDAGHAWVLLSIADNGTGMTPEVKRRAFELFFTTKSRGHGTGLGLPLVHKVAARVGGRVEIDSSVGKGTTVTMWLPATTPEALDQPIRRAAITISDARRTTLVRHVLEAGGFEVAGAGAWGRTAADLWVTDSERQGRNRGNRGKPPGSRRSGPHHVTIPTSADFQTIRNLVAEAITRMSSSTSP